MRNKFFRTISDQVEKLSIAAAERGISPRSVPSSEAVANPPPHPPPAAADVTAGVPSPGEPSSGAPSDVPSPAPGILSDAHVNVLAVAPPAVPYGAQTPPETPGGPAPAQFPPPPTEANASEARSEKPSGTPSDDDDDDNDSEESKSKRAKLKSFSKALWKEGLSRGKDELLKGRALLEKTAGLGHKPNVIPPDEPTINGAHRTVEIGWHPVAGLAGKWFAEQTGLGKLITENINRYPDPTQHWAVLVDGYSHELWMDERLDVIYINGVVKREEWHTFPVGKTRFNDEALRQAGEMVIFNMRAKRPAYNLISNNCQNFALALLEAIQVGAHRRFATSFAVYQRAIGEGSIKDLFSERPPQGEAVEAVEAEQAAVEAGQQNTVQVAAQVMEQNTNQVDAHKKAAAKEA